MRTVQSRLLFALASAWGWVALAQGIGYAQATGYYKQSVRPTLYQPLGLLDGRDATAWCSPTADPLNELLTFGLGEPATLNELRISTGNGFSEGTWERQARAKKLRLKSGSKAQVFTLEDRRGPQTVIIDPPMVGSRFSLEILDQYPSEDPEEPVCLTDVVFVSSGKPLNGPWLTTKLKYDKHLSALLGTWFSGFPNKPNHFLSFFFDGTFRYSFEPFDPKRDTPTATSGTYDVSPGRLVLTVGSKRFVASLAREEASPRGFKLILGGELPAELSRPWRSEP